MKHERSEPRMRGWLVSLVALAVLIGCGRSTIRIPVDTVPSPTVTPIISDDDPPIWISRPDLHPNFPPDRYYAAVGSSLSDWSDATYVAHQRLWDDVALRVQATRERAEIVHPYFGYQGEFATRVDDAFESENVLARRLEGLVLQDSTSFAQYQGVYYSLVYLDRFAVDSTLTTAISEQDSLVEEAVGHALSASEAESWFGFAHWSRRALQREADRLTSWIVKSSVNNGGFETIPPVSDHLDFLGEASDSLWAHHGWSLKPEFEWKGKRPPPQIEPRMKQRMVQYFLDRGFRVGLGSGCPSPIQPEEEDGEVLEPPPHHVLTIHSFGDTQRTTIAWTTEIELSIEVKNCGSNEIPVEHRIGTLDGAHPRDAAAAVFRAADFERLEDLLDATLQEIGLVPPIEFSRPRLPG